MYIDNEAALDASHVDVLTAKIFEHFQSHANDQRLIVQIRVNLETANQLYE